MSEADQVYERVAQLIRAGEPGRALQLLDELAVQLAGDEPLEAAKTYRLAGDVCRILGDDRGSVHRAKLAVRCAVDDHELLVDLRRRLLADQHRLTDAAQRRTAAATIRQIASAQLGQNWDRVAILDTSARAAAKNSGDHGGLAELDLLALARALEAGDLDSALACAESARAHALTAVDPIAYLTAALSAAGITERLGQHDETYRTLVRAWATLADVLGGELARQFIEPQLTAVRNEWGAARFAAVKTRYDEGRRGCVPRTSQNGED